MGAGMSLTAACWWTLARTVILCFLAWPITIAIERWLRGISDAKRPIAFLVLLSPFLFPELLVGYSFRNLAMTSPQWAEVLCAGLLFMRIVPVGVVTLLASPSSLISDAAIHCRWMLLQANPTSQNEWRRLAGCYWYGPVLRTLPAMGLMGLVSFQEFELAALLQTASWTDWFITAQRFGLERNEMLLKALCPLVMQLPLLVGALVWLARKDGQQTEQNESASKFVSLSVRYAVVVYLVFALICGCLIPLCIIGWNVPSGLISLLRQPTQWTGLGREILITSAVSLCAGLSTWFLGGAWSKSLRARRLSNLYRNSLLLPGLIGSLLLSLVVVALFQQSWLRSFYDTPIPWVLTLVVWLMPRAVLLRLWLSSMTRTEAVYVAELLSTRVNASSFTEFDNKSPHPLPTNPGCGNKAWSNVNSGNCSTPVRPTNNPASLLFRLRDEPQLLGMALLCYWAYLDLSTAYLLAPSGMSSGLVRLYNFMHFGRFAALSAESLLFFGTPVLVTIVVIRFLKPRQ